MRTELSHKENERINFTAEVGRFGIKTGYRGNTIKTVLLTDINFSNDNTKATNHAWLTVGKAIEKAELKEGDKITFDARINTYLKGYYKDEWDYKLSHATNILKQ